MLGALLEDDIKYHLHKNLFGTCIRLSNITEIIITVCIICNPNCLI